MRPTTWLALALLPACGWTTPRVTPAPRAACVTPTLDVAPSGGPITVDGELDEPAWLAAKTTGAFPLLADGRPTSPHTELRATTTAAALHVAVYAADEDLVDDDQVSLEFSTGNDTPLLLELTARGQLRNPRGAVPPGVALKVDTDGTFDDRADEDEEWVAELTVPWAALGLQAPPATLYLAAWRSDTPKGAAPRTVAWSPRCQGTRTWGTLRLLAAAPLAAR